MAILPTWKLQRSLTASSPNFLRNSSVLTQERCYRVYTGSFIPIYVELGVRTFIHSFELGAKIPVYKLTNFNELEMYFIRGKTPVFAPKRALKNRTLWS